MNRLHILLAFLLLTPLTVDAQVHLEVRSGPTVGSVSNSLAGLDIEPSISLDLLVRYPITSLIGVYGGVGRLAFGCAEGYCVVDTPTISGLHAFIGGEVASKGAWVRGGVMYGKVLMGSDSSLFDSGFGFQTAAGLRFTPGSFEVLPGVSLKRAAMNDAHAYALAIDIGFAYRYGR